MWTRWGVCFSETKYIAAGAIKEWPRRWQKDTRRRWIGWLALFLSNCGRDCWYSESEYPLRWCTWIANPPRTATQSALGLHKDEGFRYHTAYVPLWIWIHQRHRTSPLITIYSLSHYRIILLRNVERCCCFVLCFKASITVVQYFCKFCCQQSLIIPAVLFILWYWLMNLIMQYGNKIV